MEYFDFDTEISYFPCQETKADSDFATVGDALDEIKTGENYLDLIKKYRETGDGDIKKGQLPAIGFHGRFDGSRLKKNFNSPTGIIIVDIDDIPYEKVDDIKVDIMLNYPSVLAAFRSPSGKGIKCLYLVDNLLITVDNYRQFGVEVGKKFSQFGKIDILSITDCLILTYDPEILINKDAYPDMYIIIKEVSEDKKNGKLEDLDEDKELFDDPEEFFEKVLLSEIERTADNNYHFIQMSVFELAKFGFKSPDYDLDFIVAISEDLFKASSDNSTRLKEACEKAKNVEQTRWAYDYSFCSVGVDDKIKPKDTSEFSKSGGDYNPDILTDEEKEALEKFIKKPDELLKEFKDVVNQGKRAGLECNLSNMNEMFRPTPSTLTLVTGISGHGKSEISLELMLQYCIINDVKAVIFGSEETNGITLKKLIQKLLGMVLDKGSDTREEVIRARTIIEYYFRFIDHNKTDELHEIVRAATALKKVDHKFFFFYTDPYNQISTSMFHEKDPNQVDKKVMSTLTRFVNQTTYHHIIVAHPKKGESAKDTMPTANSPSGSGDLRSKTHNMLIVHWHKKSEEKEWKGEDNIVEVKAAKIKQANWGNAWTSCFFQYNQRTTRYRESTINGDILNNSPNSNKSWLDKITIGEKNTL